MILSIACTALSSWNVHHPTGGAPKKEAERDFIALNRAAVECGLTTAQEQAQFRATHDIRRRDEEEENKTSSAKTKFPTDMVFGISTRSHTLTPNFTSLNFCSQFLPKSLTVQALDASV